MYQENSDLKFNQIGILTRTNHRGTVISQALAEMNIPHVTVEQYEFFRRQEIKDALAHLKLLLNPHDTGSLLRILQRPTRGIGEVGVRTVLTEGKEAGLRLTDMVDGKTLQSGEPYYALLEAIDSGSICVVDVETTGLDLGRDEVIEIAGVKLVRGKVTEESQEYLRNRLPVGKSELVHGYSDAFLETNGIDAEEGLKSFFDWTKDSVLVGHNISFDHNMITSYAERLGLTSPEFITYDTLNIAHNYFSLPRYRLIDIAKYLQISESPTHKALDDARCTAQVLLAMIPLLRRDRLPRKTLVNKYGKAFQPLGAKISDWQQRMMSNQPAELLNFILTDSGLVEYYAGQRSRLDNLEQLLELFRMRDDEKLHPQIALQEAVKFCALAKNVDFLSGTDNRIPIITVHQAKGLEFDTVFLAGVVEGEFPNYLAFQEGKLDEEKRVFYVGMTRAKQQLYITGFKMNSQGRTIQPSQLISLLGRENVEFDSVFTNY
jgi:DNA helicase-2/ATP-dependent DNA helicase PcrA